MIVIRWTGKSWSCRLNDRLRRLDGVARWARSELIAARYRFMVDPTETDIRIERNRGLMDGLTGKRIELQWGKAPRESHPA